MSSHGIYSILPKPKMLIADLLKVTIYSVRNITIQYNGMKSSTNIKLL